MQPATTPASVTTTPAMSAGITPEDPEAAQVEADYEQHLELRLGQYGY